jgi:hypothetical protein
MHRFFVFDMSVKVNASVTPVVAALMPVGSAAFIEACERQSIPYRIVDEDTAKELLSSGFVIGCGIYLEHDRFGLSLEAKREAAIKHMQIVLSIAKVIDVAKPYMITANIIELVAA